LIPLKRVDLIARSLQLVSAETRWIHIGDGPERTGVEAACRDLPGHVRVDLRGSLPNDQVLALYGEVGPSLFINLSRTEGLPVSMMEAMSAGVPVIATDVGGVREIVDHQSNGVLLPADPAPAHVAAALDAFAALPDGSHARYAQAAWDTWNSRFHAERNYGTFVNVVRGSVTS
jgi:glycosyltransferase involved in cell wall biosynthesis